MLRLFNTSVFAIAVAAPVLAGDYQAQAPVAAVTVYPAGAELVHRAEIELPAGAHRLFLPYAGLDSLAALPRIRTSEGVSIGAIGFRRDAAIDREAMFTPGQAAAWAEVEAARDRVEAQDDAIATARAAVVGIEARLGFLSRVEAGEEMSTDAILALADRLRDEISAGTAALVEARAALRPLEEELDDLKKALSAAISAFERLSPPGDVADMLTIELNVAQAGPVTLELTELTRDAWWEMDYDLDLDRDAGRLAISRKLIVTQGTGRTWQDVALTLSTSRPGEEVAPSPVEPDRARIVEPMMFGRGVASAPAPMMEEAEMAMEPMIIADAEMKTAGLEIDGLSLSYVYPDAVTIASDEAAELALDRLALDAESGIHAAPRWDETAFTVARFTNTTGEPLLPGWANILRDGHLVGRERIEMVPAGAETDLGFGPIEGIRLETIFARNAEGDTGLISKSDTREQTIAFTVENLTGEPQEVRAFFPLTFSEQEDLRVRVTATPAPDETDIDRKRGVSAWDLTIMPGEKAEVEIAVSLGWPEGMELIWSP